MNNATPTQQDNQPGLMKSVLLHVAPGILVTVGFLLLKPLFDSSGYPPLMAFLLAVLLIDIPFMLIVMLFEGKKLNGRYGLDGIVLYREKVSWKSFALVFVGAFAMVYILMMLMTPLSNFLTENIFSGLPDWIFLDQLGCQWSTTMQRRSDRDSSGRAHGTGTSRVRIEMVAHRTGT